MSWYQQQRGRYTEVRYDKNFITQREGDLYNLTVSTLNYNDIGSNFTCKAENEVGFSRGFIEVTGKSIKSMNFKDISH